MALAIVCGALPENATAIIDQPTGTFRGWQPSDVSRSKDLRQEWLGERKFALCINKIDGNWPPRDAVRILHYDSEAMRRLPLPASPFVITIYDKCGENSRWNINIIPIGSENCSVTIFCNFFRWKDDFPVGFRKWVWLVDNISLITEAIEAGITDMMIGNHSLCRNFANIFERCTNFEDDSVLHQRNGFHSDNQRYPWSNIEHRDAIGFGSVFGAIDGGTGCSVRGLEGGVHNPRLALINLDLAPRERSESQRGERRENSRSGLDGIRYLPLAIGGLIAACGAVGIIPLFELSGRLWRHKRRLSYAAATLGLTMYLGGTVAFVWNLFSLRG
jgi:hypothetical protein